MTKPSKEALRRHRRACQNDEAGYEDPETGLFVLTSVYLRESQGECCGSGCRHCPWPEEEQRRAGRPEEMGCWPHRPEADPAD